MEWPRVKNILIVLLVIVNLFLFVAYANSAMQEARSARAAREELVSVLAARGFALDEALLPQKGAVLYPARAMRDSEREGELARALLGDAEGDRLGTGTMRDQSDAGELRVRAGGYFEITLSSCPQVTDAASMRVFVQEIAAKLGMQIAEGEIPVEQDAASFRASVTQMILGVPLYNCRLSAWVLSDQSAKITGRMMYDKVTILRGREPYAVTGLLLNLVEELESQGVHSGTIEEISAGYRVSVGSGSGNSGTLYALPVWKLRVDGAEYFLGAMNGKPVYLD